MLVSVSEPERKKKVCVSEYYVNRAVVGARSDQCVFDGGYWIRD